MKHIRSDWQYNIEVNKWHFRIFNYNGYLNEEEYVFGSPFYETEQECLFEMEQQYLNTIKKYKRGVKMKQEFKVHLLNEQGITKAKDMASKFSDLLTYLEQETVCLQGRELSIVKTKLEEASFFAKKAMAMNPVNQKSEKNEL